VTKAVLKDEYVFGFQCWYMTGSDSTCDSFPYKIGYDCAGAVAEIGPRVTRFKVGDEVFARLPEFHRGMYDDTFST
jgi:NADPH:quinone reductase-like Zn-dependent oxidoreductase